MFRNRRGTAVDPVPFLVVSAAAFLISFSVGPVYAISFGLTLELALACSGACWLAGVAASYHRLVWTVRPGLSANAPASARIERIGLGVVAFALLLLLLSLPFFAP